MVPGKGLDHQGSVRLIRRRKPYSELSFRQRKNIDREAKRQLELSVVAVQTISHEAESSLPLFELPSSTNFAPQNFNDDSITASEYLTDNFSDDSTRLSATSEMDSSSAFSLSTDDDNNTPENANISHPSHIELFQNGLSQIYLEYDIKHRQGDALLKHLHTHPCLTALPKTTRTLLKTPRTSANVKIVPPGEYLHLGFQEALCAILNEVDINTIPDHLLVDFNTDGATLGKSTSDTIWPIQVLVANIANKKPGVVGVYRGKHKPHSASQFFHDFLNDVDAVIDAGGITYKDKLLRVSLRCFIADAPARAFILNHLAHNGKVPCSKCKIIGTTALCNNRQTVVFVGVDWPQRTDEEYAAALDGSHHHDGLCCLKNRIPLVTNTPLEIQHLTFLGSHNKFLEAVISGKFTSVVKLSKAESVVAENRLRILSQHCPRDFARYPNSFEFYTKFKATENRQILLYTGMIVFLGILKPEVYDHYLLLHSAIRVLVHNYSSEQHIQYAEMALKTWVKFCPLIFGVRFCSYNIHGHLHLVEDYRNFGALDAISTFPFENNMSTFRKFCRKPGMTLQQINNRRAELVNKKSVSQNCIFNVPKASKLHHAGPLPNTQLRNCTQYKKIEYNKLIFRLDDRDNTCITHDGSICIIRNILLVNNSHFVVVQKFSTIRPFYDVGLPSSELGVYECSDLDEHLSLVPLIDIKMKCFRMPLWRSMSAELSVNQHELPLNDREVIATLLHENF